MRKLLFVTWDGPQVYYLEGLFSPILAGLREDFDIHVIQFTWGDQAKSDSTKSILEKKGLLYTRVDIGPRSFLTVGIALTLIRGASFIRSYIRQHCIDLVLFRSTYPGLMSIPISGNRARWIFDTDGLPIDEKADIGRLSQRSLSFRLLKWAEAKVIGKADKVLIRSAKAMYALPAVNKPDHYAVVSNGRDPDMYKLPDAGEREKLRTALGVSSGEWLLVYCGSLGPQYCMEEMLEITEKVNQQHPARLLVITGDLKYLEELNIDPLKKSRILRLTLAAHEVPAYLGASDLGFGIRMPYPSMKAVSPLKLGEYLMCGLPVVASSAIGDTEEMISGQEGCFLLGDHSPQSLALASEWIMTVIGKSQIQNKVRALGLRHFGLQQSILTYKAAMEGL
jgi:glycosyltransferase involved in cell wall biosynthesis